MVVIWQEDRRECIASRISEDDSYGKEKENFRKINVLEWRKPQLDCGVECGTGEMGMGLTSSTPSTVSIWSSLN